MSSNTESHRAYYLKNRERILSLRLAREQKYNSTPNGIYSVQKRKAKQRKIPWHFTFETWWEVWEQSGKWDERGVQGYAMCRNGDTGPYSPTNVRIDTFANNTLENYTAMGTDSKGRFNAKQ